MTISRLVAVIASFAVVACNRSEGAKAAEAKKELCPAGYFTDPNGRFCAKLPAGYKIVEEKQGPGYPSVILNDDKDTRRVTIVLAPVEEYDNQVNGQRKNAKANGLTITEEADIADGTGRFMALADPQLEMEMARAFVKGPKNAMICQAMWNKGSSPVALDICKSLRAQN